MTTFSNSPKPTSSPWGQIQGAKEIFPGVWSVDTPGHGAQILHPDKIAGHAGEAMGYWPVGMDCAKRIGIEWTIDIREQKP